ncbi:hypothetical protein CgunFtcFv8_006405 [Champsocephalus gunnari]|uniref:Uncharacterized protein n=1 Tax=Champsocephalus gunnari TaxID=52237 RepID=A0AAN8BX77_CHAGU|nr:hypothetical protein CgunFtcFv8_006405 [Champsocephalus gunnari]
MTRVYWPVTWTRAPEVDQTANTSGHELMERLQQCQRECQEVNLMLHTVTQDPMCSVCPDGWLWWGGHCYFFSVGQQDDRSWIESSDFACSSTAAWPSSETPQRWSLSKV